MRHARIALTHSELAYRKEADVRLLVGEMGGEVLAILDEPETGTHGHVARVADGTVVVAFRGSEMSLQDWKTNFNRRLVPFHSGWGAVHSGFLSACCKSYQNAAFELERPGFHSPIVVTGHSLGGAVATVFASLISNFPSLSEVHLFGSPRVGDKEFSEVYDRDAGEITYRHVNCCDIVPRLPTMMFHKYHHVGQEIYYDCWGQRHGNPSSVFKLFDRAQGRLLNWGRIPTRGIADHFLSAYRLKVLGEVI